MTSLVVTIVGLAPFFGHQFAGHNLYLRMLRIARPGIQIRETLHERRHHRKSRPAQFAVNAAWASYAISVAAMATFVVR